MSNSTITPDQVPEGAKIHSRHEVNLDDPNVNVVEVQGTGKVPFKDQAVGYAKEVRGTLFRDPETKAEGEAILRGEVTASDVRTTSQPRVTDIAGTQVAHPERMGEFQERMTEFHDRTGTAPDAAAKAWTQPQADAPPGAASNAPIR